MRPCITIYSILTLLTVTTYGQQKDSTNRESIICSFVSQPSFPGGIASYTNFIKQNLKYPKVSKHYTGRVFIEFIVNEDGSLTDFKLLKSLDEIYDKNALETLKKMPNWIPAKDNNNKSIKARMVLSVLYDLND